VIDEARGRWAWRDSSGQLHASRPPHENTLCGVYTTTLPVAWTLGDGQHRRCARCQRVVNEGG